MVWLRISRSSGVFMSVALAGRLSPVRIATYCFPPTSKVMGGALKTDTDIDLPKLFKTDIVIGSEGSIDKTREEEAAGRCERCAVIGILFVQLFLGLAGEPIDDDYVGLIALDKLVHAS